MILLWLIEIFSIVSIYNCVCPVGSNVTTCDDDDDGDVDRRENMIILLRKTQIGKISLDSEDFSFTAFDLYGLKHAMFVDYDPVDRLIFWTDFEAKAIRRTFLNSTSRWKSILSKGVDRPTGIAIDWIARNLYWTDSGSKSIGLCRIDGSYPKTLVKGGLDKPRAIAVNPRQRLMFWTDWGSQPKIERAGLDGFRRKAIITTDIIWPNGLAIDHSVKRIFWTDAKPGKIESSDFNGKNRQVILSSEESEKMTHPFDIGILDGLVYWSDWGQTLVRVNQSSGANEQVLVEGLPDIMGFKVLSARQYIKLDGSFSCAVRNGECEHLCVDNPWDAYSCLCGDGYKLEDDRRSCLPIPTPTISKLTAQPIERKADCPVVEMNSHANVLNVSRNFETQDQILTLVTGLSFIILLVLFTIFFQRPSIEGIKEFPDSSNQAISPGLSLSERFSQSLPPNPTMDCGFSLSDKFSESLPSNPPPTVISGIPLFERSSESLPPNPPPSVISDYRF